MAFGGGTYTNYNKFMPGTYINTITVGSPQSEAERGVTAAGLVLDWGPDDELFEITATQFQENAESITGSFATEDSNLPLRELFHHANRVVAYKLNSNGSERAKHADVGSAKYTGKAGNEITVSVYPNINDDSRYDVKTYFKGSVKDRQTVDGATVDQMKVSLSSSEDGKSIPEDLQDTSVEFSATENKITAKYNNIPDGYEINYRLLLGKAVTAIVPGRVDEVVTDDSVTIVFGNGAASKAEYTLEARLKKTPVVASISDPVLKTILSDDPDDDPDYADSEDYTTISSTYTTLKSQKFNIALEEGIASGADVSLLEDNDFVVFKKDGVISENAGYVFSGGKSTSSVTAGAYSDLLGALESRTFDVLVYDGNDKAIKELFTSYTKRMRDERGKYFQTVLHDYAQADHEGIISVYNKVSKDTPYTKDTSLVYWVAGYSSAVPLTNELTSKLYDGELNIDTSAPDSQLEFIVEGGHFVFHRVSATEVYTLFDVNTFTSFTKDRDQRLSENKAIRIIDYIHNMEAYQINRNYIGNTANTADGRALIWNRCFEILSSLQQEGAIENFSDSNLSVDPVSGDKHAVKINQSFAIAGTIYRVYITTYIVN